MRNDNHERAGGQASGEAACALGKALSWKELMDARFDSEPLAERERAMRRLMSKELEGGREPFGGPREGAVFFAAALGAWEMIGALTRAGADVSRPISGESGNADSWPLHVAASSGDSRARVESVRELIRLGANPEARDEWGETAIFMAQEDALRELCEAGADLSARGSAGATALHRRCDGSQLEGARILLAAGADPNARDEDGEAPLHWACKFNCEQTARELLAAGADPNALSGEGSSPLTLALAYGRGQRLAGLIAALLSAGARVDGAARELARWSEKTGYGVAAAVESVAEALELGAALPGAGGAVKKIRV